LTFILQIYRFLEAETAKMLKAFRKGGVKVAKFCHLYPIGGKDLRFRKVLYLEMSDALCVSVASLPSNIFMRLGDPCLPAGRLCGLCVNLCEGHRPLSGFCL